MNELPQELIDEIIDSIDSIERAGRSSLAACSLVNRSWRRRSQKRLFSSVEFWREGRLEKWYHIVSQNGELSSYVRRLRWSVRRIGFHDIELHGRSPPFSNLRHLRISDLSLHALDSAAIKRIFGSFGHSLQYLHISRLTVDPGKWRLWNSLLPCLQSLVLSRVCMVEEVVFDKDNQPPFTFTGHIGSCNPHTVQFFRWVARFRPCLRGITVTGINREVIETLNLVVKNCSATLTTIILRLGSNRRERGNPQLALCAK